MQTQCQWSKRRYSVIESWQCATNSKRSSRKTDKSQRFLFEMRDGHANFPITSAETSYRHQPMQGVDACTVIDRDHNSRRILQNPHQTQETHCWLSKMALSNWIRKNCDNHRTTRTPDNGCHTVQILLSRNVTPLAIQNVAAMHSRIPISGNGNVPVWIIIAGR